MGETRKYLVASVVGSVIVLAGSTVLSPVLGVYGVILASVAGSAVSLVVAWGMIGRRLGSNVTLLKVWRVYLASGVAAVLVYPVSFLHLHPIIVTVIGGALFLVLVIPVMALIKAVSRQDMLALDSLFRGVRPVSRLFGLVSRYYEVFARNSP
jgi:O-antigen/teichoic acid export membrane protein